MRYVTDSGFLAEWHARFQVPRAAVVELVERAAGTRVTSLKRLAVGDENEVYRAGLDGGSAVYARIRRPGEGSFEWEVWAMERARAAGVPVPDIHAVEMVDTDDEGARAAMVVAEASGRQLAELLPTLTREQRHTALTNLGRALARVHAVRTPGVDRPDMDGGWPDPAEVLRAFVVERTGHRRHLVTAGLNPAEVETVIGLIGQSPDTPARTEPVLCHGDLHAAHVFVDDDLDVSGMIDWGLWHGGTAIGDLAYLSMRYEASDFDAILTGHGAGRTNAPAFRRRLALSVVNQAIGHLAWSQSIGNAVDTAQNIAALRTALTDCS